MKRFDEKCLVILEKLDEMPELGMTFDDFYNATTPTTEKALERRLYKLKEYGLITNRDQITGEDDIFYRKTVAGNALEKTLNGKPFTNWLGHLVTQDIVGFTF
jgi:DNA-binding HxlR family transcriptional regulator